MFDLGWYFLLLVVLDFFDENFCFCDTGECSVDNCLTEMKIYNG